MIMMHARKLPQLGVALIWVGVMGFQSRLALAEGAEDGERIRLQFGHRQPAPGWILVAKTNAYGADPGFGFEPGAALAEGDGFVTSDRPFQFSVRLPEGNCRVKITLGDTVGESETTVKAELRRLMLERVRTDSGKFVTREVIVNLRNPLFEGDFTVRLKPRERETEFAAWDDKLTLEFNGARPCLRALEISPADVPTVFLLGDSTVCDQPREPWGSWGQMLPRFFKPEVAVANHAESGESLKSSLSARRFDKVFSLLRPGDWLFLQYGHNDMKDRATNALADYRENLRKIVARTREKGGMPVLVTSMERKDGVERDTLAGYPDAVREIARETGAALIDLHAMSRTVYRALGPKLDQAFQDGTHHNNFGGYELARCVVEGIRRQVPALAKFLASDVKPFDPEHPDEPEQFNLPASPEATLRKPDCD